MPGLLISTFKRRIASWIAQRLPPAFSYQFMTRCDCFIRKGDLIVSIDGVLFPFLPDDSQKAMYYGLFEPEVSGAIHRLLRPGGCFVDVGANVGYFSAIAAAVVGPSGRVFAFEPHDQHYLRLNLFVDMNCPACSVHAYQAAVCESDGIVSFYESNQPGRHSLELERVDPQQFLRERKVRSICLDSFARDNHLERIDLLKIDVEGAEHRVLLGARSLLKEKRIGQIIVEIFHPGKNVPPPLLDELKVLGLEVVDAKTWKYPVASPTRTTSNAVCKPR